MILIELLIFLSTIFPLFHLFNALLTRRKKQKCLFDCAEKMMSILIPCFNEEDVVRTSVTGLLAMDYRNYEVFYINDGSSDDTLNALDALLNLKKILFEEFTGIKAVYQSTTYPNFYVIDKQNGGKSIALNTGIRYAKSKIIVTLDADSVLAPTALKHMNKAFEDNDVVAAGGAIHIMQGYDTARLKRRGLNASLISLQILEYLKGFYIYKYSLSKQKATAIISGAFGVFKRDVLLEVGGFRKTLGEDIDITMSIQKLIYKTPKKIVYLPEALCYTQCPESLRDLMRQRIRWQKGFIECVFHHIRFLLRTFLIRSLSFHFLVEAFAVGICSGLFTVFTYIFVFALAFFDIHALVILGIYYAFCIAINLVYTVCAYIISARYNQYPRMRLKKTITIVLLDLLFYRYFGLLMYLGGTISYFWAKSDSWNKVARIRSDYGWSVNGG